MCLGGTGCPAPTHHPAPSTPSVLPRSGRVCSGQWLLLNISIQFNPTSLIRIFSFVNRHNVTLCCIMISNCFHVCHYIPKERTTHGYSQRVTSTKQVKNFLFRFQNQMNFFCVDCDEVLWHREIPRRHSKAWNQTHNLVAQVANCSIILNLEQTGNMSRRAPVFQFKRPLLTSAVCTRGGADPLIAMQACTYFELHHKPMGIKADECLCHISLSFGNTISESPGKITDAVYKSLENNFLNGGKKQFSVAQEWKLRFNSCTRAGSLNSSSLDGSTFENATKRLFSVCWSKHDVHFWSRFKGVDWSRNARLQWCFIIGRLCVVRVWWNVSSHQHPVHYLWWHVF